MESLDWLNIVSLLSSISSFVLAIVAITFSRSSEKEVRSNFQSTNEFMNSSHEKTKEVLAEIDKRAAIIDKTVSESQQKLMETMMNIVNETVIPKKADLKEQMGFQFAQSLFSDPQKAKEMMEALEPLMKMSQKSKDNDNN